MVLVSLVTPTKKTLNRKLLSLLEATDRYLKRLVHSSNKDVPVFGVKLAPFPFERWSGSSWSKSDGDPRFRLRVHREW